MMDGLFVVQQVIDRVHDSDSVFRPRAAVVQRDDKFFMMIPNPAERRQLALSRFRGVHRLGDLNIYFPVRLDRDKVDLLMIDFPDRHVVTASQQFKILRDRKSVV